MAADPTSGVEAEPDIQPIVRAFRGDSRPHPRSDPWRIDQFELRTHPDGLGGAADA